MSHSSMPQNPLPETLLPSRFQASFGAPQSQCRPAAPLHKARALTQGGTQAQIELDGKVYDLRITRAGKLILTK